MTTVKFKLPSTFLALGLLALSFAATTNTQAQESRVDPAAVKTLQRMTDYLSKLQGFSVHTENTLEDLLDSGQRADFDVAANVIVRRPNQIQAERVGHLIDQIFYYDRETLTLYNPADAVYVTASAPETIEELFDYLRESAGVIIPVSDLLYRNAYAILMEHVNSATFMGRVMIGGVTCVHLAFRRADAADFQVWVADGDQPLPCKYVFTDTSTPENVSTVSVMSNWNVAPAVDDATFKFVPPEGAELVTFIPLD